jgi:hypothetical protein
VQTSCPGLEQYTVNIYSSCNITHVVNLPFEIYCPLQAELELCSTYIATRNIQRLPLHYTSTLHDQAQTITPCIAYSRQCVLLDLLLVLCHHTKITWPLLHAELQTKAHSRNLLQWTDSRSSCLETHSSPSAGVVVYVFFRAKLA